MSRALSVGQLAVVGSGAWGTVIAILLARNGHSVALWSRREEQAREIERRRENVQRLPGVTLPGRVRVTSDLAECCEGAAAAFVAVPSSGLQEVVERLPELPALVSCSKGFAGQDITRLSQLLERAQPHAHVAVLTGPNLAPEIAAGLPAAAVAASTSASLGQMVQAWLQSPSFRIYTSPDPIGAEVGGALKNVIALAAGMSDGLRLGDNAKASIVTRGLAEIVRLGNELGARRETLYGLAGLGDMIATCSSRGSRNHRVGEMIARGADVEELRSSGLTAEGIPTVRAVHAYAVERGVSLPIASEVYRVAFEGKDPSRAISDLMTRASGSEW
ncbi:MAG TPA: NAD(P)H-dependent glycerol-3-phosphate dehydrogenase [Trueperaceae bacterium]